MHCEKWFADQDVLIILDITTEKSTLYAPNANVLFTKRIELSTQM